MSNIQAWIATAILIAKLRKPADGMASSVTSARKPPHLNPGRALELEGIGGA